ncbi:Glycerol-3-phosphate dehydrogenase [NAD(P)+] [Pseudovibrio axinellae]|uniref:Glycerol-3-phosphate dehydrogenase [NAD(P)+] n=1 Tax=Pseudovibrio axinellae TaxID=989403 RepID=A0A166A653_9HYPH|nr:NAD(P)H-dependent glycerol-3-phosphate dehydrogenase [Pseudovibrio axinellae]KZL20662.1 Glycerol-3-phosphate dehydrogenase [NAD(P)+] [Pseudovibrio axinellae]SER26475.1 glycerol-3-phosphate dehydrogenase (NAD(P)+) [Pseudovibrio axinellae]
MVTALNKIAVLGGGSWGTALALAAARAGREVMIWARDAETINAINTSKTNPKYLPGIEWTEQISATSSLELAVSSADAILLVTPAQTTRVMMEEIKTFLPANTPVVLCAKGIEQSTGSLLSEVIKSVTNNATPAALSGPSFGHDVAKGLPTAVTIAAEDGAVADQLSFALASESFRPYATDDLTGVQIGGALKNVLAIACGAAIGYGLGASAQAALTARGFAELTRLGMAMNARSETLTGLSGLGDLVLCCSSTQSRNFAFGLKIGQGRTPEELLAPGQKLAEGAHSASIAVTLAAEHSVDMPIAEAVSQILTGKIDVAQALSGLMTRPLKRENHP